MTFRHDTEVKNFLDTVLRDFLEASGSALGAQVSRTTFTRAYTQYVIKDMIMKSKGGQQNRAQDRLIEALDWRKQGLDNIFGHMASMPEEVVDLEAAGKLGVLQEAIEFTKQRINHRFRPSG